MNVLKRSWFRLGNKTTWLGIENGLDYGLGKNQYINNVKIVRKQCDIHWSADFIRVHYCEIFCLHYMLCDKCSITTFEGLLPKHIFCNIYMNIGRYINIFCTGPKNLVLVGLCNIRKITT